MKFINSLVLLFTLLHLTGCNDEVIAVLDCAKPSKLETTTGLKVSGNVSIKKAQGELETNIGKELTAEFTSADPDKWISIAATYQYQTCQFINSAGCGELSKGECLTKKQGMFNNAFDKINTQLNEQKEKQEIEKKKQVKIKVDSCVAQKKAAYEAPKNTSSEGGSRAASPGLGGGRITDERELCHSVGSNQVINSATTSSLSCHGGRCSVTSPVYTNNNTKACVTTKAWSESRSYGGGGSGKYRLNVIYKDIATQSVINSFTSTCASENV